MYHLFQGKKCWSKKTQVTFPISVDALTPTHKGEMCQNSSPEQWKLDEKDRKSYLKKVKWSILEELWM